jgi:hypothetical protein
VVSRYDPFAFESSKRLVEIRKDAGQVADDKELTACSGNPHGTEMLTGVKTLPEIMLAWFKQVLLGIVPESTKPVAPAAESAATVTAPTTNSPPAPVPPAVTPAPAK